jgi:hypothetical protein
MINFPGFEGTSPTPQLSTGFVSDDDLVGDPPVRQVEPFTQQISFTSRWQVDLFLSEAAFSVHVLVGRYQWLLVAPLQICFIVQDWSVRYNSDKPALIRVHPNLTEAFLELSLALAPEHELIFLSPSKIPTTSSQLPGIGINSFPPESMPEDLPQGPSEGFFSPVSMLIASPTFDTDQESRHHTFNVIYNEFGNAPVRLRRCHGAKQLDEIPSSGYSLVIPFHEFDRQYKDSLVYELMMELPYFCWPCPILSSQQVLERMEPTIADRLRRVPRPSGDGGPV